MKFTNIEINNFRQYYNDVNIDLTKSKEIVLYNQWKTQGLKKMNNGKPHLIDSNNIPLDVFSLNSANLESIMKKMQEKIVTCDT